MATNSAVKKSNDKESLRIFKDLIRSRFRQARADDSNDEDSIDDDEEMESEENSSLQSDSESEESKDQPLERLEEQLIFARNENLNEDSDSGEYEEVRNSQFDEDSQEYFSAGDGDEEDQLFEEALEQMENDNNNNSNSDNQGEYIPENIEDQ